MPHTLLPLVNMGRHPKNQRHKTPPDTKEEITRIQQVVGSILYYAISVDLTVIMALSTITSKQAKSKKTTLKMYIKCYII